MDETTGSYRELHMEELHRLHYQMKTMTIRVAGHVAHIGKKIKAYRVLWERKRPPERHGHRADIILKSILED